MYDRIGRAVAVIALAAMTSMRSTEGVPKAFSRRSPSRPMQQEIWSPSSACSRVRHRPVPARRSLLLSPCKARGVSILSIPMPNPELTTSRAERRATGRLIRSHIDWFRGCCCQHTVFPRLGWRGIRQCGIARGRMGLQYRMAAKMEASVRTVVAGTLRRRPHHSERWTMRPSMNSIDAELQDQPSLLEGSIISPRMCK